MLDEKIEVIRRYLRIEFPDHIIEDQYNFDLGAQIFRVSKVDTPYIVRVTQEFIDDNDSASIEVILQRRNIANLIRENRGQKILLRSGDAEILPD